MFILLITKLTNKRYDGSMYYLKTIQDKIRVPPKMFERDIKDAIVDMLRKRYEGKFHNELGLVLSIDNPKTLDEGLVIPGDSGAYYNVEFEALTFKPEVNEVFKGDVKELVDFGAFCSIGPFQGLLHVSQIGKKKFYYDNNKNSLSSKALNKSVKKEDELFLKVSTVSMKENPSDSKIGLTMRPDGLGKKEWLEEEEDN